MSELNQLADVPGTVCLTVDVEWACDEVLEDLIRLFTDHGLPATFFCTHIGITVPGHERALHPNFRRDGDIARKLGPSLASLSDEDYYREVLSRTLEYCPEAIGFRAHALCWDSAILYQGRNLGLSYSSSYFMPLVPSLAPFQSVFGITEYPIYYMDHLDLLEGTTEFRVESLQLERPGLKVLDFHPNMVYLNARTESDYESSKAHYHDAGQLRRLRKSGPGVRSMLTAVLDSLVSMKIPVRTIADLHAERNLPRDHS
jgi:hypothetical protein